MDCEFFQYDENKDLLHVKASDCEAMILFEDFAMDVNAMRSRNSSDTCGLREAVVLEHGA